MTSWDAHRDGRADHEHKDMASVLKHYGADHVPDVSYQRWSKVKCPFHEDSVPSAQTDGSGFRCFTCDLFYPAPLVLIRDREGGSWDDAHTLYHNLAGTSDSSLPGSGQLGIAVPGTARHRATSRRGGTPRRRS